MTPRPEPSEDVMRTADETFRRDMRTIDRAEELLLQARTVAQRVEERVRRVLATDPPDRHLRLS